MHVKGKVEIEERNCKKLSTCTWRSFLFILVFITYKTKYVKKEQNQWEKVNGRMCLLLNAEVK